MSSFTRAWAYFLNPMDNEYLLAALDDDAITALTGSDEEIGAIKLSPVPVRRST